MKNILIVGAMSIFSVEFENIEAAFINLCGKQEIVRNEWDQLSITTKNILNKNKTFKEPKRNFVNKFNKNKHR